VSVAAELPLRALRAVETGSPAWSTLSSRLPITRRVRLPPRASARPFDPDASSRTIFSARDLELHGDFPRVPPRALQGARGGSPSDTKETQWRRNGS
jgi:hypothetical protein